MAGRGYAAHSDGDTRTTPMCATTSHDGACIAAAVTPKSSRARRHKHPHTRACASGTPLRETEHMALPFEIVNTRKLALAAKYGYAPNEVAKDGIDDSTITVTIDAYDREQKPSQYAAYENDSPFVRVQWTTAEQAEEAREARLGDYLESLEQQGLEIDGDTVIGPTGRRVVLPDALRRTRVRAEPYPGAVPPDAAERAATRARLSRRGRDRVTD